MTPNPTHMTPMKRLHDHFEIIKNVTNPKFKHIALNKAEPRTTRYNYEVIEKKGVASDFVLLFENRFNNDSFAFTFTYIDLPPSEQSINFSYKPDREKKDIFYSQDFSLHDFKSIMKPIIQEITNSQSKIEPEYIFKLLNDSFMKNSTDFTEQSSKVSHSLKERIAAKEEELNIQAINHRMEMTQQLIAEGIKKVDKAIKRSPEFKEINLLSKRIQELNASIKKKHLDLTEEHGINALNKSYDADFALLNKASTSLKKFIQEESKILPFAIKRSVKNTLKIK